MTVLSFIFGLIIGSFLNVCILRLPEDENIAVPSHCTKCGNGLKWYDLFPVISYVILRGQCRYCGDKISPQYPAIELLSAILALVCYQVWGLTLEAVWSYLLLAALLVHMVIDLRYMLLLNSINIFIAALAILSVLTTKGNVILHLLGGIVLFGIGHAIVFLSKNRFGEGDVKLYGGLGLYFGLKLGLATLVLSFLISGVITAFLLATKIKGLKDPIPFGPFIIAAAVLILFWGNALVDWYLNIRFY